VPTQRGGVLVAGHVQREHCQFPQVRVGVVAYRLSQGDNRLGRGLERPCVQSEVRLQTPRGTHSRRYARIRQSTNEQAFAFTGHRRDPADRVEDHRAHIAGSLAAQQGAVVKRRAHLSHRVGRLGAHQRLRGAQQRDYRVLERSTLEPPRSAHRQSLNGWVGTLEGSQQHRHIVGAGILDFKEAALDRHRRRLNKQGKQQPCSWEFHG
jgi:hypothetical protein